MAGTKVTKQGTRPTKRATAPSRKPEGFTAEERAAAKERTRELRAARTGKSDGEADVQAKIAAIREPDRAMAKRVHEIVRAAAPELVPRTWYGMPAYGKGDKIVCFFQDAQKFKSRYATLGFSDKANLDDGAMWPVAFALKELTPTEEARITALVKKAVS